MKTNTLELRLDWSELDHFGHINNINFYKFIQSSRVYFWETVGLYQDFLATNKGPILATAKCDFLKPLYYPGQIRIELTVAFIKNTSFSFLHKIYNQDGELAAVGQDVMVYMDYNTHSKLEIPQWLKDSFTPYLEPEAA